MYNKATLIGRLGRDPETRYSADGKAICNFSVATSETWKDKSGEKQERVEWHNITAFDRLAEICQQYLHKGSQVFVEGRIQTDKYTDKAGVEKYATKIICNTMKMLGSKSDSQGDGGAEKTSGSRAPSNRPPAAAAPADFDDSIPF